MAGLGLGPESGDELSTLLADSARAFVSANHSIARHRSLRGDPIGLDRRLWSEMAELGWLSLCVPEARGGGGLGTEHAAILARIAGAALLNEPFVACGLLPAAILSRLEAGPEIDSLLAQVLSGERLVSLAWQEGSGLADPGSATLAVMPSGDGPVATGVKVFVPWLAASDRLLVTGTQEGAPVLCVIDAATVRIEAKTLIDGAPGGTATFDRSPVTTLAEGRLALAAVNAAVTEATAAAAAELVGLTSAALDMTAEYLRTRVQFGKRIGSFQALQHRLVDHYNQVRLADASVGAAVRQLDRDPDQALAAVSGAKARASEIAERVTADAIQLHGAIGYTDEYDIGLYLKGALRRAPWLGSAKAHRARAFGLLRPSGEVA